MSLRASAQPAWILHRRDYRDSSLIVDLLSRDHGRIAAVARGARKARGGAQLQAFRPLQVDFFQRGELATLGRFEAAGAATALSGLRLWCGFYCNELILRLVSQAQADDGELFEIYQRLMSELRRQPPAQVLRHYEYRLLSYCGFGLDGAQIDPDQRYTWDPLRGAVPHRDGVTGQVLHALIDGDTAQDVALARPLLAIMLEQQLAGRPLKTAAMLRDLAALRQEQAAPLRTKD